MDKFAYNIFSFVKENRLINPGDKILISLSGGLDSVSLFRVLLLISESMEFDLHLCHFHHGLRQDSDEEQEFVQKLSIETSVPLTVHSTNHLSDGVDLQNRAREWRNDKLREMREENGFSKIALGHHLNDLVETQLWKMMRGGSLFALAPMQIETQPFIRPLLYTPKEELKTWCIKSGFEWREDGTNQQNNYTRNKIRNQIIPYLKQNGFDKMEEKMLSFYRDASDLREFFDESVPTQLYQKDALEFTVISKLPRIFALEIVHRFLLYHKVEEINRSNIEEIYRLVKANRGNWKINLKSGRIALGNNKQVRIQ